MLREAKPNTSLAHWCRGKEWVLMDSSGAADRAEVARLCDTSIRCESRMSKVR